MTGLARLLVLLLLFAPAWPAAAADELDLAGPFEQGQLAIGRAPPGARVRVAGAPVRVSPEGLFLVGLGRDAPTRVVVQAELSDGRMVRRTLTVKKRDWVVQRIDGLPPRQVTPSPEDLKRIEAERILMTRALERDTAIPFFAGGFAWPTVGRLSGVFGSQRILNSEPRSPHYGVDVAAPEGAPVVAAADGVVALAHPGMFFNGKTVVIDHGHGLTSLYMHMSEVVVADGARVARGQPIGRIGRTGRATGAHLHWGVSLFRTPLDPALLVGPIPAE